MTELSLQTTGGVPHCLGMQLQVQEQNCKSSLGALRTLLGIAQLSKPGSWGGFALGVGGSGGHDNMQN